MEGGRAPHPALWRDCPPLSEDASAVSQQLDGLPVGCIFAPFVSSTIGAQTIDVAYQRAVELLTNG
jgi:hypothetical protein